MSNAVRVLVVEDEALIGNFIADALAEGGFEACTIHSGEAALSTFRDGRERCRALLTDIDLGDGISGWELARQIREITPAFPVVYMTGASAGDWKSQCVADSVLIEKPFMPARQIEPGSWLRLRSFERARHHRVLVGQNAGLIGLETKSDDRVPWKPKSSAGGRRPLERRLPNRFS